VTIILITWDLLVHEYLIWYRLFSPTYWWLLMASVSFPLAVATSWPEERREGESGWIVWTVVGIWATWPKLEVGNVWAHLGLGLAIFAVFRAVVGPWVDPLMVWLMA
jgi:hypothetical protein